MVTNRAEVAMALASKKSNHAQHGVHSLSTAEASAINAVWREWASESERTRVIDVQIIMSEFLLSLITKLISEWINGVAIWNRMTTIKWTSMSNNKI